MSSGGEEEFDGSGVKPPQQSQSSQKRHRIEYDRSRTYEKRPRRARQQDMEESSKGQSWSHSRRGYDDDENRQKRIESGWAAWRQQLNRDEGRSNTRLVYLSEIKFSMVLL